jgi:alpha-L-fucosidase 2
LTRFKANGVEYTRESFVSFTDQVIVMRLTASVKGALSFTAH